jgi:preprotein translocase subunit SecD
MMRLLRSTAGLAIAAGVIACAGPVAPSRAPDTTQLTVSIPIHTTDKAVIGAAVDVMSERLRALGVGNFSSSAGTSLTFTITIEGTADQAAIDAVLRTPGVVSFLGWPTGDAPADGGAAPSGAAPLFDAASQIIAATKVDGGDAPTVEITFGPGGTAAVAAYTKAHVGSHIVIILDGTVLSAPLVMDTISDGKVDLSFPSSTPIKPEVIAAIMASGPLPAGWIAP